MQGTLAGNIYYNKDSKDHREKTHTHTREHRVSSRQKHCINCTQSKWKPHFYKHSSENIFIKAGTVKKTLAETQCKRY